MAGLDPAIHECGQCPVEGDARIKSGHDGVGSDFGATCRPDGQSVSTSARLSSAIAAMNLFIFFRKPGRSRERATVASFM